MVSCSSSGSRFRAGNQFVGKEFNSYAALSAALEQQCSLESLLASCTDDQKIRRTEEYIQPLNAWGAANRKGEFMVGGPEGFRVRWKAIAAGKKILACQIIAYRNPDSWLLLDEVASELVPLPYHEVEKRIKQAEEKEANQPSQPMLLPRHG